MWIPIVILVRESYPASTVGNFSQESLKVSIEPNVSSIVMDHEASVVAHEPLYERASFRIPSVDADVADPLLGGLSADGRQLSLK